VTGAGVLPKPGSYGGCSGGTFATAATALTEAWLGRVGRSLVLVDLSGGGPTQLAAGRLAIICSLGLGVEMIVELRHPEWLVESVSLRTALRANAQLLVIEGGA